MSDTTLPTPEGTKVNLTLDRGAVGRVEGNSRIYDTPEVSIEIVFPDSGTMTLKVTDEGLIVDTFTEHPRGGHLHTGTRADTWLDLFDAIDGTIPAEPN